MTDIPALSAHRRRYDRLLVRSLGLRIPHWDTTATIRWHFTDSNETYRMELSNGALTHHRTSREDPADLVVTLTRAQLLAMIGGAGTNGTQFDGDEKILSTIVSLTDQPNPEFSIVTP